MPNVRTLRVAEQIQEEISGLLLKGIKDPRIGFVTITGVKITADLRQAKVFFCSPGSEEEREKSKAGLQSAAPFIRKTLLKRLKLKTIPELEFVYDISLDEGNRIETLLAEVRKQEGWDDPTRVRGSASEISTTLKKHQVFLVTSHRNPDGDAVASTLAMVRLLQILGKQAIGYQPDKIPENFAFLPGFDTIQKTVPPDLSFDATVILDCSELTRVGALPEPARRGVQIVIDHHLTAKPCGDVVFLNPNASAIGELIDQILQEMGIEPDPELATCIYTSILTDTGSFHYSNSTPEALRSAARMVAAGALPWEIALRVYESFPLKRFQLLTRVLQSLEISPAGNFGSILISKSMFDETGTSDDIIDGFINFPRSIQGVEVAIQFRELSENQYKVSFRSRGKINVAEISGQFGGGGHANASGCTLSGSLSEVKQMVFEAVESSLASL
jgi:bifunctional oligoribonuclease and PAP phosphatase NrnA